MYKYLTLALVSLILAGCTADTPSGPISSGSQMTIPSPVYGSGKHTLTVYADFQCPACIAFDQSVAPLFEGYAERGLLQIVYKQFPLSMHRNAERDALAALCAAEQEGKYLPYKKSLYALEKKKSGATVSDTERIEVGEGILDTEKLRECISTDRYLGQVRSEVLEGERAGVTGTPTVYFDGKKLSNGMFSNLEALKTILDRWTGVGEADSGEVVAP